MSQQSPSSQPVLIVSLAAPEDARQLAQLEKHLFPLQQAGLVALWSERHISAGSHREAQMHQHLDQAKIIILLLSADFFVSNECNTLMMRALQRARQGQAHVIPLLLRSVAWRATELGALTCLPTNGRPISRWGDRDEAFHDCVEGISALLTQPAPALPTTSPPISPDASGQTSRRSSDRYFSCFLSYAHQDEPLAQRLHADLQAQGVRCWFAPHDMKIGAKIRPTIDQAINQQEKLLLLISEHALQSVWIEDEVEAALEHERRERREMLFPVRLDESISHTSQAWAAKLRRTCYIGDFTNWVDQETYEQAFERLLRDLKKADE